MLDEMIGTRRRLKQLNKVHHVFSVQDVVGGYGVNDEVIYEAASILNCSVIVTVNCSDFKRQLTDPGPGIICISENLNTETKKLDGKLCSILRKYRHRQLIGQIITLKN